MDQQMQPSRSDLSSMTQLLKCLKEAGYRRNLTLRDGKLVCTESDENFHPDDLTLEGSFRFEGQSDPEDMSIIYALQANNGSRALIVDAFGPYSDPRIAEFITSVQDRRRSSHLMEDFPPAKTLIISMH